MHITSFFFLCRIESQSSTVCFLFLAILLTETQNIIQIVIWEECFSKKNQENLDEKNLKKKNEEVEELLKKNGEEKIKD